ncbi:MAG: hypothetical protein ACJ79B_01790 [Gemmatimonadaceae bacterium]
MPGPHTYSSTIKATAAALAIVTVAACRDVGPAFGPTPTAARNNAEQLFGGIAQRFTNVERNPKFRIARGKLGKNALTPSVIFNDTSVWTSMSSDNSRMVTVEGEFGSSKYVFSAKPTTTIANEPGDSRHTMVLRKVGDNEFDWFTNVEIAAGSVTANDLRNVLSAWMKSAERRSPVSIRDDYRSSFPRTTASLARLFSLDSLRVTNDADGATTIFLGIRLNPEKLRPVMPAFADYLDKYATESKYKSVVLDKRGVRWIELAGEKNFMTLKLRSINGHFAPLSGALRPIPEDLLIDSEFTTKILLFHIGFRKLIGNVTVIDGEHERGWFIRFTKEPDWKLPPTVGLLIKTPLRRPFEKDGIMFRLALQDAARRQTMIARRTSATVQESAILRFLNRLSGTAMGDFVGKAESEENRFSADVFNALRADARAGIQ